MLSFCKTESYCYRYYTHTLHVLSQHPSDELINSCAGMITNKGVWLILPHVVQKVNTFTYSCVLKDGLCKEITM